MYWREIVLVIIFRFEKEGRRLGMICLKGNGVGIRNKYYIIIFLLCNIKYVDKLERSMEKTKILVV